MSGIGGVACFSVRGREVPLYERTEIWQVPGHDSFGVQVLGLTSNESTITAILYDSDANIETWYASLAALCSQIGTFQDDFGQLSTPVLFRAISPLQKGLAQYEGGVRGLATLKVIGV